MERKCARCGKKYKRVGNTRFCEECAFLNKHRKCNLCGKVFVASDVYEGKERKACYECEPIIVNGKPLSAIDQEVANARKAGMTYGHYQQWKYMQQCQTNRMIKKLNREL